MKQGKAWGWTQPIFNNGVVEIHRIHIDKGGFCSKHYHDFKHNKFYVISGKLKIKIWKSDYDLCDETTIQDGESTSAPPKEYHTFEALEDTEALEIYWVELDSKDIVRDNCGGKLTS